MRGTVLLLLNSPEARARFAEHFRADELRVYEMAPSEEALKCLDVNAPDVIVSDFVTDGGPHDGPMWVRELRRRVDHAVSIIVFSDVEYRDKARGAGADWLVPRSALPADVLYEVHRALILRRTGRRLPGNWPEPASRS